MGNMDFTRLTFSMDTWPLKRRDLTLFPAERRVVCESRSEAGVRHAEHRFSDAEWQKIAALLAVCNFAAWSERYEQPMLDGTVWHLELLGADGQVRKSDGLNAYPDEWRSFRKFCNSCAESVGFEPDEQA